MKNLTNRLMVAAVAMAAVAGVASAQSMKARVPFNFQVAGKTMAAGHYDVAVTGGASGIDLLRVRNTDNKETVLALPATPRTMGIREIADAKLVFRCTHQSCALVQVWTGTAKGAFTLPAPKSRRDEEAALIVIRADSNAE